MNSIVRIIIRGLLSGEIKPDPQVFQYLKELSERQLQRHSRILRLVRPATPDIAPLAIDPSDGFPDGEASPGGEHPQRRELSTSKSFRLTRDWLVLAARSCGRRTRVTACLLFAGVALGVGGAETQASIPGGTETPAVWADTAYLGGVTELMVRLWGTLYSFSEILLIASGTMLVGLGVAAGWQWFCQNRLFVMRPYEVALQELESAQHRAVQGRVWNSRRVVLGILYDYVQAQWRLTVPGVGRDGLLRVLTLHGTPLTTAQRALLSNVLDTPVDEHVTYPSQLVELHEKASRFVWATACSGPVKRDTRGNRWADSLPVAANG